jgi:hypothetical protein
MKLYSAKISTIADEVVETLTNDGSIEVSVKNLTEAKADLAAVMTEFLNQDFQIRAKAKDVMNRLSIPYDQFGRERSKLAKKKGHPSGQDIEKYLARQFIESFMISKFVDEVYAEDKDMYKSIVKVLQSHHVDENEIREEARSTIRNIKEGTVEYEMSLTRAIREVKRRRGLSR